MDSDEKRREGSAYKVSLPEDEEKAYGASRYNERINQENFYIDKEKSIQIFKNVYISFAIIKRLFIGNSILYSAKVV